MKIIPVIDLKDGVVVHARQGNREGYQPINTYLCKSSGIFQVIDAFLSIYQFDTFYIADLNAITNQGNHDYLIAEVLTRFPRIMFWIDKGYRKYDEIKQLPENTLPVLGSESYKDETISEIKAYKNNFILSLDYSNSGALGAKNLFSDPTFWPKNVIIMTLGRVGCNNGPDFDKLKEFCRQYPGKSFIAAGGIRNKQDLMALSKAGIHQALVASALHSGAVKAEDIAEVSTS
ncbi:HisA/HisF-related TIM barrel protein [Candidatus Methylobacter oryzae]|uniref:Nickel transporter n=1 Tax=Candidatus Methylobacter oryzae TaxID=2497749 RepID=A0ABY3CC32_9GAMM|nr:HisA/HisF-related TIM barrel protein [Candidatus Methylobacter oryzae]TRW96959.1 nickel transporter [Candidatus Methylobacter oryzae]